jgi:glycosyltransferase involved in cell wall biosynthesis
MYNRERFIARALKSCLEQDFENFEIIVVDDDSTDNSVEVVRDIKDSRLRLIRHESNQERMIARNNGARASKGEWLIWFDSDDELVPNALSVMQKKARELHPEVRGLRFRCRMPWGHISPDPPYCDEVWDYEQYIRWLEAHYGRWSEYMPVVHRETTQLVLFPEDRARIGQMQYHLDFAYRFKGRACTDILRIYHQDSDSVLRNPNVGQMLRVAPMAAARMHRIMSLHGSALQRWAPKTYGRLFVGMITQFLLSGQRRKAWEVFGQALRLKPHDFRICVIMALGLTSPTLLAQFKGRWERMRISRTL